MIEGKTLSFFGKTDQGKNRTNNEDAFIAQNIWDDQVVLAAAIDGVGGYDGGEIAAAIARKTIVDYLESYPNGERSDLIKQAVIETNNAINKAREGDERHSQMSCVLTAVLIDTRSGYLHMAHIGDTRLYQYSDGQIKKLSHDHSLIGYREEIGDLTEEEAMHHPQRNVLGRDAGSQILDINTDLVETASFPLASKSTYILCSDGLSDMLTSSMMVEILKNDMGVEEKVHALINKANEEGGNDNITVVLVEYVGPTIVKQEEIVDYQQEIHTDNPVENNFEQQIVPQFKEPSMPQQIVNVNVLRIELLLVVISVLLFVIMCISGYSLYLANSKPVNSKSASTDSSFVNKSLMDSNMVDSSSIDSIKYGIVNNP